MISPNTDLLNRVPGDMMSQFEHRLGHVVSLAQEYHDNPDVRLQAHEDPIALLSERGMRIEGDVDVRILANTDDVFYLLMPPDPNIDLADEDLSVVAGGKSAGSAGTGGTVGTVAGTLSSVSSMGTAGSAS